MSCRFCEKLLFRGALSHSRSILSHRTLQSPGITPTKILPPKRISIVGDVLERPETFAPAGNNMDFQKTGAFLQTLTDSVSKWKIQETVDWKDQDVIDSNLNKHINEASEMKLPTTEVNRGEKLARIGGKYKRPAFTRERIMKRHRKKRLRKNRYQVHFWLDF